MALVGLVVMLTRRSPEKRYRRATKYATKGADKFVSEGRYEEAGRLAMISNNWEEAIDLYKLAHKPDLAAAAARRAGQLLVAADLYDIAGDAESAALCRNAHKTLSSFPPTAPLPNPSEPPHALDIGPPRDEALTIPRAPALPQLDRKLPPSPPAPAAAPPPPAAPHAAPHLAPQAAAPQAAAPQAAAPQAAAPQAAAPQAAATPEAIAVEAPLLETPILEPHIGESAPPKRKLQAGSVPPHPSFGSKPPGKSSYSFISEPPKKKSSAPPAAKPASKPAAPPPRRPPGRARPAPRRRPPVPGRATRPIGTADEKPLVSEHEVAALVAELEEAGVAGDTRDLRTLAGAAPEPDILVHREKWYGTRTIAPGLEIEPIDPRLTDASVVPAATADDIASLLPFVKDQPCDLANIEVYHRIGLAYAACGQWEAAAGAFSAVDGASAGYREAGDRAAVFTAWRDALGDKRSGLGTGAAYDLVGELGRGAHAVVYRASPWDADEDVALKVYARELQDDKTLAKLVREVQAASTLNHPDIVRVHDHGIVDGRPWVAMDLVEGAPIDAVFAPMTIVEKLQILVTLLDALAFAHDAEVIHGDVRPSNLIVRPNGRVALTEFGLTRALGGAAPSFMAPEQLHGSAEDVRTDIFGVGVTAYALLSGNLPFDGRDRAGTVAPLSGVPHLPEVVDEAVRKALAPDPVRRWPSAKALKRPLQAVLDAVREDR